MRTIRLHTIAVLLGATGVGVLAATAIAIGANTSSSAAAHDEDARIAKSLATMLRAGRTVVSRHQDQINDASTGNKGFDSKTVAVEAIKLYREATGIDPMSIDLNSRHGKLIHMQMDSIAEVIDAHQDTINRKGVGFKGFIPAVFGRLVNESFGRRAVGLAAIKVTAPPSLVRNGKAKPDAWENAIIRDQLMSPSWPKNQPVAAVVQLDGKVAHRTAVPEYYGASCLACHGSPKGEIDITGYPKEGGHEGDLGGVISITLYQ